MRRFCRNMRTCNITICLMPIIGCNRSGGRKHLDDSKKILYSNILMLIIPVLIIASLGMIGVKKVGRRIPVLRGVMEEAECRKI